jgi:hypothetical protein
MVPGDLGSIGRELQLLLVNRINTTPKQTAFSTPRITGELESSIHQQVNKATGTILIYQDIEALFTMASIGYTISKGSLCATRFKSV